MQVLHNKNDIVFMQVCIVCKILCKGAWGKSTPGQRMNICYAKYIICFHSRYILNIFHHRTLGIPLHNVLCWILKNNIVFVFYPILHIIWVNSFACHYGSSECNVISIIDSAWVFFFNAECPFQHNHSYLSGLGNNSTLHWFVLSCA